MQNGNPGAAQPLAFGCNNLLGPLPEPRMWYDHATQKCHGMAPTGGTNERLWDACDMQAYAAAAVAAERERWRARVEQAFHDGYWARETYNDSEVSDADEKWAGAKAGLLRV